MRAAPAARSGSSPARTRPDAGSRSAPSTRGRGARPAKKPAQSAPTSAAAAQHDHAPQPAREEPRREAVGRQHGEGRRHARILPHRRTRRERRRTARDAATVNARSTPHEDLHAHRRRGRDGAVRRPARPQGRPARRGLRRRRRAERRARRGRRRARRRRPARDAAGGAIDAVRPRAANSRRPPCASAPRPVNSPRKSPPRRSGTSNAGSTRWRRNWSR